jgi:3-methyl-2-oxobutanoate hydroxymethyltransferase
VLLAAVRMAKVTIQDVLKKKGKQKICMLTCYDYSFARILDQTCIDILLVGDSLANVVLGLRETRHVSFEAMLAHTKAVARAVERSLVVADMPYVAYQRNPAKALYYAKKFIDAGARAVKLEWFPNKGGRDCICVTRKLLKHRIPVMAHIGLTPQTVHLLGGYKIQGRDRESAKNLLMQAKVFGDLGAFSIVLECIPYQLARIITDMLKIPTIGIGAGRYCDGQVLVLYDMLGFYHSKKPLTFVRTYAQLHKTISTAARHFITDIQRGRFPSQEESFTL